MIPRESERFILREDRHAGNEKNYTFEFDLENRLIQGSISDISIKGMRGVFESVQPDLYAKLEQSNELFIKMLLGEDSLLAGMKLIWMSGENSNPQMLSGGFHFTIISPDDRIKLHALIGDIRNKNAR